MDEPVGFSAPGRRVVTGINSSGKSVILSDGPVPKDATFSEAGKASGGDLWIVSGVPGDITDQHDPLVGYMLKDWPSKGEVIARMISWSPGFEFPMHRSDTIDILFVISGQIELLLDEGSTVLRTGETVVQCGTNHGWRVVGNEPCTFAGVLIDATPKANG
jgi:quercetin dioxygenase-like cupin family protein